MHRILAHPKIVFVSCMLYVLCVYVCVASHKVSAETVYPKERTKFFRTFSLMSKKIIARGAVGLPRSQQPRIVLQTARDSHNILYTPLVFSVFPRRRCTVKLSKQQLQTVRTW